MVDYCTSCKHCRTHIPATQYYCKLNAVERLPDSTCCWGTKKYPSKFEPQPTIPEKPAQCLCETCRMTVEQCRGQQLSQSPCPQSKIWQYCPAWKQIRKQERAKALDELREKYVEFLNHPCPELADKYDHCCDADWCGLCTLDEVLEELRQAGVSGQRLAAGARMLLLRQRRDVWILSGRKE